MSIVSLCIAIQTREEMLNYMYEQAKITKDMIEIDSGIIRIMKNLENRQI